MYSTKKLGGLSIQTCLFITGYLHNTDLVLNMPVLAQYHY
jgi:hypothetical protein